MVSGEPAVAKCSVCLSDCPDGENTARSMCCVTPRLAVLQPPCWNWGQLPICSQDCLYVDMSAFMQGDLHSSRGVKMCVYVTVCVCVCLFTKLYLSCSIDVCSDLVSNQAI